MINEQKFQYNRSEHSSELIFGLIISILLHSILFLLGDKYLLRALAPERQQGLPQPIPIEFVEVPLEEKPPPETSRRANNNSIAGGEAKRDRSVSIARSAPATVPKASASSPTDLPSPTAKLFPPQPRQPVAVSPPSPSLQKPQPDPPKAATAPTTTRPKPEQQKITAAPTTLPKPEPQVTATPPAPTQLKPEQQKILTALRATPLKPEPPKTVATPTITQPKPKLQTTATPLTTTQPKPSTPQENENQRPTESTSEQLKPEVTPRQTSQAQQSKLGAASLLGGPVSLSSSNLGGDRLAALPNSNRSNQGIQGIDARQDVDLGPYLEKLQQQVKQQWMPGLTQSSWQTVIYFSVSRSGQISNLRIARTSGNSATDEVALSAVKRAVPFAPLPTAYTEDYINIQFTFNINAYGGLELRRGG